MGGAERYALELSKSMASSVPTTLLSFGETASQESLGSLTIKVLGNARYIKGQRTNPIALSLLSELVGATIVHCHQQHVVASSLSAVVCRMTGRRVFVSDLGGGGWDVSGYMSTDNWYHGHLHISEYSRDISSQTDDPRAHVILGGVDTCRFSPDPTVPKDGNVLFVGRLLPHKGINYLIEGLPSGMALSIAGQPSYPPYFETLRSLALEKNVNFHNDLDDATLLRQYRSASCIVLPSVYKDMYGGETRIPELLGQTLLEGMACGLPAICTAVASMPEIVVDGVTGFIVPPNHPRAIGEKLAWLRDHPEMASAMGEAGRRLVCEKFTWPAVVKRCLDIYQS